MPWIPNERFQHSADEDMNRFIRKKEVKALERELAEALHWKEVYFRSNAEARAPLSASATLEPQPPNAAGETMCHVRWMVETPAGWLGAWDKGAFAAFAAACAQRSSTTATLRPEVVEFAKAMQFKLEKNARKKGWPEEDQNGERGWKGCDPRFLNDKLLEEVVELQQALDSGDLDAIRLEAADVGNIAMMLADNAGALSPRSATEGSKP